MKPALAALAFFMMLYVFCLHVSATTVACRWADCDLK